MKLELILIGAWLVINVLYLIPLPLGLLEILSPTVASAYAGIGTDFGYLSLDVHSSYTILMLSLYYFIIFILGVVLINSRTRIKIVLALFFVLGVVEAIYGMYLVSLGKTGTLVQVTSVAANNASGTFINKNHFVAFESLCFILGLALRMILSRNLKNMSGLDFKIKVVRFISQPIRLLDVGLFLILAGIWNSHSRAGVSSFILALLFLFLFKMFSQKIKTINYKLIVSVFVLGIVLLIAVADDVNYIMNTLGDSDDSLSRVEQSAEGRLLAFNQAVDNYPKYWFSGVGPGAYQVFFVNHRMVEQTAYFDHAHNDYVEFVVEYGLFSLVLLAMLLVFLYRIFMFIFKTRSSFYNILGICVISTMIYLLLHGTMDFNVRIPANVMTIILAISAIYGRIVMSDMNIQKK
jgi:O-antigen ligase